MSVFETDAMSKVLLIDLGNTRIKWRFDAGTVQTASDVDEFAEQSRDSQPPVQILACVVGDEQRYQALYAFCLQRWSIAPRRLVVSRQALGVSNHYQDLSQQGADRWAAVLGAASRFPQQTLLIISAGTALVVDTLTRDGQFLGGTISPGFGLMKQALFQGTAQLPLAQGSEVDFPCNTHDAIETGCLRAIRGIISEAILQLSQKAIPIDKIILFGGDAARLQTLLNANSQTVDNLVLDGLYALHLAADGVFTQ
ncbi:type III pantothenate kinase [Chitinibacter sp. S2-10]|uniref:type III pantothenate kinase n=1 Tax=Chitinibacter sp. S2-10 TaxID=3373597 RepID=UPI003977CA93